MKTIHLNLASRPYRDFRVYYAVLGSAALVALVLMTYNVLTAWRYLVDTKEARSEIAALETETTHERETAEAMEKRIGAIDAVELDDKARFINSQIRERVFSWSTLMERLEKLLPGDVRLTTLNPTVEEDGTVNLSLSCVSRKPDGLVTLLDRLYSDPAFKNAFPSSDNAQPDGTHRIEISTTYLPNVPAREVKK
jgi:Tfp pilus assembly protein PilN